MREQQILPVLAGCTADVLERMFSVRALGKPSNDAALLDSALVAAVAFHGDPSGRLILQVSRSAARSIAADFLGEEEPVLSEQQVEEVICELANIICGSVLSSIEDDSAFRLQTPQLQHGGAPVEDTVDAVIHRMNLERGTVAVAFQTGTKVCPIGE